MPLKISAFKEAANIGGQVRLDGQDPSKLIIYGNRKILGKFKIAWMKITSRYKADNRRVMEAFIKTIKEEYGQEFTYVARKFLKDDQRRGKPLTGYKIKKVLEFIEAQGVKAKSEIRSHNALITSGLVFSENRLDPRSFTSVFDKIRKEIENEYQVNLSDSQLWGLEKEKLAFKVYLNRILTNGGDDPEHPRLLTPERAKQLLEEEIRNFLVEKADEIKGNIFPPPTKDEEPLAYHVKSCLNILTHIKPDRKLFLESAFKMRDAFWQEFTRKGRELTPDFISQKLASFINQCSDYQLKRIYTNLSLKLGELIKGIGLKAAEHTAPEPHIKKVMNALSQTYEVLSQLKAVVQSTLQEKNIEMEDVQLPTCWEEVSKTSQSLIEHIVATKIREAKESFETAVSNILTEISKKSEMDINKIINWLHELRWQTYDDSMPLEEQIRFDRFLQTTIQNQLSKMDNQSFLSLYRGMMSSHFLNLRLYLVTLFQEDNNALVLQDLNTLEGMINMELAERVEAPPKEEDRIRNQDLYILSQVEKEVFKEDLRLQPDAYLHGNLEAYREVRPEAAEQTKQMGITPQDFLALLRKADLTINFNGQILFGENSPFFAPDGRLLEAQARLKNVFELGRKDSYTERRLFIEQSLFSPLRELDGRAFDPQNHPIYAALNVGRQIMGGAGTYGFCYFVLKDEVKETRATFSPTDSFHIFDQHITRENVELFKSKFSEFVKSLSPTAQKVLTENQAQIFARLDQAIDRKFGFAHRQRLDDFISEEVLKDIKLPQEDESRLATFARRCFTVEGSSKGRITTYDKMVKLLEYLNKDVLKRLGAVVKDGSRVNVLLGDYIEAQIFGGVDLGKDVKELVISNDLPESVIKRARQFAEALNIPLKIYDMGRDIMTERMKTYEIFPSPETEVKPDFESFVKEELPQILDIYLKHEKTFDPTGIHGRSHICRALIYARAMANFLRERGVPIDTYVLYRAVAFHDAGRKGNGMDEWEADSARLLQEHLQQKGISNAEYLSRAEECILHASAEIPLIEKELVRAADTLEIIRLTGLEHFDPNRFWFLRDDFLVSGKMVLSDVAIREKLIKEVADFIEFTELTRLNKLIQKRNQEMLKPNPDENRINELTEQINLEMEKHQKISNEEYFNLIEQKLLQNPERFPILYHYYTMFD